MNTRKIIGIGIGAIVLGIFLIRPISYLLTDNLLGDAISIFMTWFYMDFWVLGIEEHWPFKGSVSILEHAQMHYSEHYTIVLIISGALGFITCIFAHIFAVYTIYCFIKEIFFDE